MSKYYLARWSAVLSFVGSVVVFLSFQATSTSLLLVKGTDKTTSFCVGDVAMLKLSADGKGLSMATKCPLAEDSRPTAVVSTDLPWLSNLGWFILTVGFFMQIFSIEPPRQEGKWKKPLQ